MATFLNMIIELDYAEVVKKYQCDGLERYHVIPFIEEIKEICASNIQVEFV